MQIAFSHATEKKVPYCMYVRLTGLRFHMVSGALSSYYMRTKYES